MAECRAISWMKAVTLLFWQQCRMPIFIYGCFEDTKAQLQGAKRVCPFRNALREPVERAREIVRQ